jgi:topoisomerase-4 subunit A
MGRQPDRHHAAPRAAPAGQDRRRLELLEGYIIAYLNLDRIIEIIRTEDEPKPVMMAEFGLTDRQAEAILNMRLRSLRKLEEMELRRERDALLAEQDDLNKLLESPARQRTRLKRELAPCARNMAGNALGRRRTTIAEAAPTREFSMDAMIEKEPVTVILSARGWICAARGIAARYRVQVQGRRWPGLGPARADDRQAAGRARHRAVLYAGCRQIARRARLWRADPHHGRYRPDAHIVALVVYRPKGNCCWPPTPDVVSRPRPTNCWPKPARARRGDTKPGVKLMVVREIPPEHDHVAVMGENRKLVIFGLSKCRSWPRGRA